MYYQLKAPNKPALLKAYWDAEIAGMDPEYMGDHRFNIGTGQIEKVSSLISKHKLDILVEADNEPTGYRRGHVRL